MKELKSYSNELLQRPSIIAINKVESEEARLKFEQLVLNIEKDLSMNIKLIHIYIYINLFDTAMINIIYAYIRR